MLRLYDSLLSGNSWKVRILLNRLERPFERVTLDIERGDTKDPTFRCISRFARIPVLQLEDGRTIVESGAILLYLAEGTALLPSDPYLRTEITSWLFFEQADLQRAIALPRVYHLRGVADRMSQQIERLQADGYSGLEKLEEWLLERTWLVDEQFSVADIGVFAYVSLSPQGGYDLERFPSICHWISRVKSQPRWHDILD